MKSSVEKVVDALAAAGSYALVVALRYLYRLLRGREGIGLGDAKLLADFIEKSQRGVIR